jgi:outer membrane protein assembly factor BamB
MPGPLAQGQPAARWTSSWTEKVHTPIVADGRVFFLALEPNPREGHLIALDTVTGDTSWETGVSRSGTLTPIPAFSDGLVVTGTATGLEAYEAATGIIKW